MPRGDMKSVIAALVALSVAGGCTPALMKKEGKGLTAAGTGGLLLGALALETCVLAEPIEGPRSDCDTGEAILWVSAIAAVAGVAVWIGGAAQSDAPAPRERTQLDPETVKYTSALPPIVPPTSDPTLKNFTQQASMAARTGQCVAVKAIAKRVEDLDAAYRRGGFLTDPLVVACLQ